MLSVNQVTTVGTVITLTQMMLCFVSYHQVEHEVKGLNVWAYNVEEHGYEGIRMTSLHPRDLIHMVALREHAYIILTPLNPTFIQ